MHISQMMKSLWSVFSLVTQIFETVSIGPSRRLYMAYFDPLIIFYNMIKGILLYIGLNPSPHDPWLINGVLTNPSSPAYNSYLQYQLHVGLYVDDFF